MRNPRIRTQVAFVLFILLPASAGVIAIHASATCERFVRTYVTKPVRNRVSKRTATAWAAWRVAHPNWKPNPKIHRPKYIMTREEAIQKENFACSIDTVPTETDGFFKPADIEAPLPVVELHALDTTDVTLTDDIPPVDEELTPTEVAELTPPPGIPFPPPVAAIPFPPPPPPSLPVVLGAVPEPSSLVLLLSGFAPLGLIAAWGVVKTRSKASSLSA